jgi:predicted secreted Zn-dependent protease
MKKFIALILAVLLLSLTVIPVSAQDHQFQMEAVNYKIIGTSPTGLIDYVMLDENGNVLVNKGQVAANTRNRSLLSSFDLRSANCVYYQGHS